MPLIFVNRYETKMNICVSLGDTHLELVVGEFVKGSRNLKDTPYEIVLASTDETF